ncbi:SH3 domain-containing protein [Croceibacterium aestuarii]|uniref:SH3 domain-containing protein n=1 Tax=Croceibacterium aestuarii TaxID=3064139 RepID=UPI00272E0ACB|nr:SH3 domain-containing protein [Croceibacterium sp. D39]
MRLILPFVFLLVFAVPAGAQDRETPYWASLRAEVANMRVGPSENFPIDWVYKRKGLPVKVVRVMEGWRLVVDQDGAQGWFYAPLLSPERAAVIIGKGLAAIRAAPAADAALRWKAEPGVVGKLGDCQQDWCEFDAAGRKGWVAAERLWGDGEP